MIGTGGNRSRAPRRVVAGLAASIASLALAVPTAGAEAPPPELPPPSYQSVAREVLIEMDDGIKLAATVTFPSLNGSAPAPGRFPVVLAITPYGRNALSSTYPADMWATRGMVAAVVDTRGTGGSGGDLSGNYFSPREARDGAALVEHFGTRPYSTGKVGMAGGSYVGITQYLTAEEQPPHLAAIAPAVALGDLYRDAFAHGGVPNLFFDLQYIGVQGAPGLLGINTDPSLAVDTVIAKLQQLATPPGSIAFDYLKRPNDDDFYRARSPIYRAERIQVPVLVLGAWQDGLLRGATEMYPRLARRDGVETRLHIDPCTHKGCGPPFAPFTDAPNLTDVAALTFEFLSAHLQGADVPRRPRVTYYEQEGGRYRTAAGWPPAGVRLRRMHLGDGVLSGKRSSGSGRYLSKPTDGLSAALNKFGTVAISPYVPLDQRLEGPNGLTFRTARLERELRLAGPIALRLSAAASATDTDFYAKLSDVAPDGTESPITEGALRASHRALDPALSQPGRPYHPHTDPKPIKRNRFYAYDIEIWPTAYRFAPGHRLQLRVTSSDLPTHLPGKFMIDASNLGGLRIEPFLPAWHTIRFSKSYLTLPVMTGR